MWLAAVVLAMWPAATPGDAPGGAQSRVPGQRAWTIYLAQDKHLDYNWCGSTTEIELRMATLVDYYLDLVSRTGGCWNLDGTLWLEVYRRHRGEEGARQLLEAIRRGRIGCPGNRSVLLWGILSTELALRACCGTVPVEQATGQRTRTALIMENPGLAGGLASILTECGFDFLARGIYALRAESYVHARQAYPLFWWQAPSGKRILVRWDRYDGTSAWGGYAEAFRLAAIAGEKWDALRVRSYGSRNTPDVFQQRKEFIRQTVARYEAYGPAYPISSILLLGTNGDNWTCTDDYQVFIRQFNAASDARVRIVDARYEDFFAAAEKEIRERKLTIPVVKGSFGISWEEWAAHLAGPTVEFREAERLMRLAEARHALAALNGKQDPSAAKALQEGFRALLDFAEHDFGGVDWRTAALSADVRSGAAARALTIARSLGGCGPDVPEFAGDQKAEQSEFSWRGGRVKFDPSKCAITSLIDERGGELVPQRGGLALGEFVHTRYPDTKKTPAVFPPAVPSSPNGHTHRLACSRSPRGVQITSEGTRWGFGFRTRWLLHEAHPWIDVTYRLENGWSPAPQSVQFCFPANLDEPVYRYDQAGAVLRAGPSSAGGDDLPGANPSLWAAQTFASAHSSRGHLLLLMPDTCLVQFGGGAVQAPGVSPSEIPAAIVSMPMMNLTRNDWQLVQGGRNCWEFRYRLVLAPAGAYEPLWALKEAQRFGTPTFLQVPGTEPALAGLRQLDISFDGGPVTALKVSEDGKRIIVRLWNVRERPASGSLKLPDGWTTAQACDALERPLAHLQVRDARAEFTLPGHTILAIGLPWGE